MGAAPTNSTPKVSVIIPSYKTADLMAACLESVFAQTFTDFEAIVVNDGSPDTPQLERVLEPYQNRIVYLKQENKRAAGARNNAIRNARGEFVAFLDSDDSWFPNHLELQMGRFAGDPSLALVYSNALLVGDPTREKKFMDTCPSQGEATFEGLILERCQIPISTVVARKQAILDAGLFDETLPRCDDYDMWVRVAFHGGKIAYGRAVEARLFTGRPGSLGVSRPRMLEAYWNMLDKFQRSLPLSERERKMVKQRADEIRAHYLLEEGKSKLSEREFSKARQLIAEANRHLHNSVLSLTVMGLRVAPSATGKFISFWNRIRSGTPA
jgi:glycosyltransferase involved in cell wall biosynthesis